MFLFQPWVQPFFVLYEILHFCQRIGFFCHKFNAFLKKEITIFLLNPKKSKSITTFLHRFK